MPGGQGSEKLVCNPLFSTSQIELILTMQGLVEHILRLPYTQRLNVALK